MHKFSFEEVQESFNRGFSQLQPKKLGVTPDWWQRYIATKKGLDGVVLLQAEKEKRDANSTN